MCYFDNRYKCGSDKLIEYLQSKGFKSALFGGHSHFLSNAAAARIKGTMISLGHSILLVYVRGAFQGFWMEMYAVDWCWEAMHVVV